MFYMHMNTYTNRYTNDILLCLINGAHNLSLNYFVENTLKMNILEVDRSSLNFLGPFVKLYFSQSITIIWVKG